MICKMLFPTELPTWVLFAEFLLVASIVVLSGRRFVVLADELAKKLNIGGGWIGLVLLASVTSLPELITSATATVIDNIDLAMGGILGSCCFNLLIIVLINWLRGGGSVLREVSPSHVLSSSFSLLLIGLALIGIVMTDKFINAPGSAQMGEWVWVGLIAITYFVAIRLIYQFERNNNHRSAQKSAVDNRRIYAQIAVLALVIVGASWWLAQLCDILGDHEIKMIGRPLGATFVGAVFLALATSLPEVTTSIKAVRMGNLDMALGNIFGSNMFNIFVIPMIKVVSFFNGESLLMHPGGISSTHNLITGLLAILLTAITIGGLTYQSKKRVFRRFGFDSVLIALVYVMGMSLLLITP